MSQLTANIELRNSLRMLRDAVAHLALPAADQEAYLVTLGTPELADELALEFDDIAGVRMQLQQCGLISQSAVEALDLLEAQLERMSGEAELGVVNYWLPEALATQPEWATVRTLASDALRLLQ